MKALNGESALPTIVPVDRAEWVSLAREFQDYTIRQAWDYGTRLAEKRKAGSEHVAFFRDSTPIGIADIRIKEIPFLGGGLAFSSYGPLFRRGSREDFGNLESILQSLKSEYVLKRRLVLRIQPALSDPGEAATTREIFGGLGFSRSNAGREYRTYYLDLSPPLEDLRANLKRRWRRHLNQSDREDLAIEIRSDSGALIDLVDFHNRFIDAKGFQTDLDAGFYSEVQYRLPEEDRLLYLNARKDGELVAGIVVSLLGNSMVYLLGGRNEIGSGARASYQLHWRAIRIAKDKGVRWYDLGGIDPDENEGVYVFKQGLGGMEVTFPGPYEIEPENFRATLFKGLESLYRLKGRLRIR